MKKSIIILSLLACISTVIIASDYVSAHTPSDREDVDKSCKLNCHKPEKKRTCAPTPISHATTIKHSGCYCLTRDIKGTIVIAADDVMLDLNCHEIDANGGASALVSTGHTSVTIENGSIENSTVAAALFTDCHHVVVSDMVFTNNSNIALEVVASNTTIPSTDIVVLNSSFTQGQLAIFFNGTANVRIEDCLARENTLINPQTEVIGVHNSDTIEIINTSACANINNISRTLFADENAIIRTVSSNNVTFNGVKANDNTGDGAFIALGAFGVVDGELAKNISMNNCQGNNNICSSGPIHCGIGLFSIDGFALDHVQGNGNITTNALFDIAHGIADFTDGIFLGLFDAIITHSPANNGTLTNSQGNNNDSRNPNGQGSFAHGILTGGSGLDISYCQANSNGSSDTFLAFGIEIASGIGSGPVQKGNTLSFSQAYNTTSHDVVFGIAMAQGNSTISNCVAENTQVIQTAATVPALIFCAGIITYEGQYIVVKDCTVLGVDTSSGTSPVNGAVTAGFAPLGFPPFGFGPSEFVTFENCIVRNITNVPGANASAGFYIWPTSAGCQVINCEAYDTNGFGFLDVTPDQSVWLSNKAQNNTGGSYSGVPAGVNNIVTYSKGTGNYSTPPTSFSNLDIQP